MMERPILFSDPMVRALLAGEKTQTRRAVKGNPVEMVRLMRKVKALDGYDEPTGEFGFCETHSRVINKHVKCPYGQPGDRLWVRESFRVRSTYDRTKPRDLSPNSTVIYEADAKIEGLDVGKLRPGIFMPRWASRITLEVTNVRVQRLQDLSEEDAKAEGCNKAFEVKDLKDAFMKIMGKAAGEDTGSTYRIGFATLWEEINGPGTWDANPWVYAVTFSVASAQRQDEERSDTTSNLANTGA